MTVCQCYRHADHGPHEWGETFHCPGNGPFMEAPRPGRFVSEILRDIESSAATAAPTSQEGGENIMHLILNIDGVNHEFTEVNGATAAAAAPATLTIKRPFVVYDVNGDRVDGYKYESRARRNNDARFAGTGYWLGNANTGDFEFVSA